MDVMKVLSSRTAAVGLKRLAIRQMVLALLLAAFARHSFAETNDFSPGAVGGVFSRPTPSAQELAAYTLIAQQYALKPRKASRVGTFTSDAQNRSNELIVFPTNNLALQGLLPTLAASPPGSLRAEDALVQAVENGDSKAISNLGNPVDARYVLDNNRLDEASRALLAPTDPQVRLLQYVVLRYDSVASAMAAQASLSKVLGAGAVGNNNAMQFSFTPNDPYFAFGTSNPNYGQPNTFATNAAQYQWGMQSMNFPAAWQTTLGGGYLGDIDSGFVNDIPPNDVVGNYRSQFSVGINSVVATHAAHGTHVAGILVATSNNSVGVSGACPNCSLAEMREELNTADVATAIQYLADRGVQVINMSFEAYSPSNTNYQTVNCANYYGVNLNTPLGGGSITVLCDALTYAHDTRQILLVASAGNFMDSIPAFPAREPKVLAVGGTQINTPTNPLVSTRWMYNPSNGSSAAGTNGVTGPAKGIVSTMPAAPNAAYNNAPYIMCGDVVGYDESGPAGDGYGSCTGTSMAAPHVAGLGGILRSINPILTPAQIQSAIQSSTGSGTNSISGYGTPNAATAVTTVVNQTPNKMTPLFYLYSGNRLDSLYTTIPQMGSAAIAGTLQPSNNGAPSTITYYSPAGTTIQNYSTYPGQISSQGTTPLAQVWVFTTPINPKNASLPLTPLYRMSWKCGDASPNPPTAICNASPQHMDTTYTTSVAGIAAFQGVGYKVDGIEGYIYPMSGTQPTGTVQLMRMYNPARDDFAIFPSTESNNMTALGYTQSSGSNWIGYVYLNTTGTAPTIQ